MNESYLKDLLWRGREIEFDYNCKRYTVKLVNYHSTSEYTFGPKWGNKISSSYFEGIWTRRDYGYTLQEMLQRCSSGNVYIY